MPETAARARWSPTRRWLAAAYVRDGRSAGDIAAEAAVSKRLVLLALARHDIPRRRRGRPSDSGLDDGGWLREQYVVRGRTTADIGRELGRADATVRDALVRHGIAPRPRGGRPGTARAVMPAELSDTRWLRARYLTDGLSIRAIAEQVGVSATAVRNALVAARVPRRSPASGR